MKNLYTQQEETGYCIYCDREVSTVDAPAVDDDGAWDELANTEHGATCEWILTRAHRLPAVTTSSSIMMKCYECGELFNIYAAHEHDDDEDLNDGPPDRRNTSVHYEKGCED